MRKVIEFKRCAGSSNDVDTELNELIKQGWEPYGIGECSGGHYEQVMARYEDAEPQINGGIMIAKKEVLDLINERIKKSHKNLKSISNVNSYAAGWEDGCIFEMQSLHDEIEEIEQLN